jgi:hypothetical protein
MIGGVEHVDGCAVEEPLDTWHDRHNPAGKMFGLAFSDG